MDNWESVISQIEHSKQQIVESIEAAERLKVKSPLHAVSPNSHNRNPNGVNNVQRGSTSKQLIPTQGQNSSKLSDAKRVLCINCGKDRTIPFVVEGGSENGELIFVGAILEPLLSLHVGDVLFAINGIQLSGRVLSEVSAFLYTLFYERNEITIELIPAGGIPIDIREVLEDNNWSELHSVLRDNVYLRTVPCTTRPPTEDEVDGEHYYFVSTSRFIDLLEAGVFLEHGIFQGHLYGVPRPEEDIRQPLPNDQTCISPASSPSTSTAIMVTDTKGPLPPNWEVAYSENGEKYFIDHNSGTTQWEDPREVGPREILPEGWERVDDESHGTFYVDHINKRTQYEPPMGVSVQSNGYGLHQPGAVGTSQQMYRPPGGHFAGGKDNTNHGPIMSHYENGGANPTPMLQEHDSAPRTNGGGSVWQKSASIDSPGSSNSQHSLAQIHSQPQQLGNQYNSHGQFESRKTVPQYTNGFHTNSHYQTPNYAMIGPKSQHNGGSEYVSLGNSAASNQQTFFTRDPSQLRGELITTMILKGNKGLGFTLIGNDGSNLQPEFIQIKSVIPNGPAATDGTLRTGDVLVYVNDECMLGAWQNDACRVFRSIPVGEPVRIHVCRGYPLVLHPADRIVTENVYCPPVTTNFQARSKENIEIHMCKGQKGFGFTITDSLQGQRVKTVLYPDSCPNLLEGDIILEIDGRNVRSMPHAQLVQTLQECQIGHRARMLVSRYVARHRSRTPTAGFRYGEQKSANTVVAPRSKTPAPANRNVNRNGIGQQFNPTAWNTTIPRSGNSTTQSQQPIRPSSTLLGFSSTPNYVPISAFGAPSTNYSGDSQLITINLIRKPDGFGFRLLGGQEMGTPLTVGAIIPGGAASDDGRLRERDEITEIDGKRVQNDSHDMAVDLIKRAAAVGHVKLVVRRYRDGIPHTASVSYGTRNYDYEDSSTNCTPYDVQLSKQDHEDFGCTIISQNQRYISRIVPGGPADRCGKLRPGDCVLAINGLPTYNMTHQQVVNYIKSAANTITFTIDPAQSRNFVNGMDSAMNTLNKPHVPTEQSSNLGQQGMYGTVTKNGGIHTNRMDSTLISVDLSRGAKGFGFSIRGGIEFEQMPLFILRIAEDGPAAADGRLHVGDQLIEINGESTVGMSHERAIQIIKENPTVRLLVKRPAL